MSIIAHLGQELPPELSNDLRLRTLGNKEILTKSQIWVETSGGDIAQCPVPAPEAQLRQQQPKNTQKYIFLPPSSFTAPPMLLQISRAGPQASQPMSPTPPPRTPPLPITGNKGIVTPQGMGFTNFKILLSRGGRNCASFQWKRFLFLPGSHCFCLFHCA